jgi:hypothetical protein
MGQFTGLFNGLENAEAKAQPETIAAKNEKRNPDKIANPSPAAPPARTRQTAGSKPKAAKPNGNGNTATTEAASPIRGKRSHPDYTQAPAFVRKDTYKAVKIALINDERGLDYSDLVGELLTIWLKNKK